MNQIGFIGAGHIATAIMNGMYRGGIDMSHVLVHAAVPEESQRLKDSIGISIAEDNREVVANSKFIFLAVPAIFYPNVVREVADLASPDHIFVSLTPGYTLQRFHDEFGDAIRVVRIMPNTPSSIGEGMILYTCGDSVTKEEEQTFLDAMAGAGKLAPLPERLIDAGSSVAGCGPAFVDLFIEALADGGVACGLPRATALELAAQMVAGSARLVLESGSHPGVLKDAVCSPGGTTIQGVRTLEKAGFRGAVMDAVIAAYEKNANLK